MYTGKRNQPSDLYYQIGSIQHCRIHINYITDGDITGVLSVIGREPKNDIYYSTGGGPEGVLAASALDAYGCFFQGRFIFENENDKLRAKKMGIKDLDKKYNLNEIVTGDSIFCATGITNGDLVSGIKVNNEEFITETLLTHKSAGIKKKISTKIKIS